MSWKRQLAFGAPFASPGHQSIGTYLISARHFRCALARVQLAHNGNLQLAGILLSGHKHCSPPFNVIGPLTSCLNLGVQSNVLRPEQVYICNRIAIDCKNHREHDTFKGSSSSGETSFVESAVLSPINSTKTCCISGRVFAASILAKRSQLPWAYTSAKV